MESGLKKAAIIFVFAALLLGIFPAALAAEGEAKIIKEFSSASSIEGIEGLVTDRENTRFYDVSARFDVTAGSGKEIILKNLNLDLSGQSYLNQWIYLPKAQDSATINILLGPNGASSRQFYYIQTVPANWEGWKLVSLPLDGFVRRNDHGIKLTDVPEDLATIHEMLYAVNSYLNEVGATAWSEDSYFSIDNVWAAPDQQDLFPEEEKPNLRDGVLTALLVESADGFSGNTSYSYTEENGRFSGGSIRMDVSPEDRVLDTPTLNLNAEDYQYMYLWMYSPQVNPEGSTINVQLWSEAENNAAVCPVPVDWEGWKLVEIPLDGLDNIRGTFQKSNIHYIRLNVNGYANFNGVVKWQRESYVQLESIFLAQEKRGSLTVVETLPAEGEAVSLETPVFQMIFNNEIVNLEQQPPKVLCGDEEIPYEMSQDTLR